MVIEFTENAVRAANHLLADVLGYSAYHTYQATRTIDIPSMLFARITYRWTDAHGLGVLKNGKYMHGSCAYTWWIPEPGIIHKPFMGPFEDSVAAMVLAFRHNEQEAIARVIFRNWTGVLTPTQRAQWQTMIT